LVGRRAICLPGVLCYVVTFRADDVSHSLGGVAVLFSKIGSSPVWHRQAWVWGSVSVNYSRSGTYQMFPELVLLFCALCFCKRREKKPTLQKNGKTSFQ
jgi:hypothetical protein